MSIIKPQHPGSRAGLCRFLDGPAPKRGFAVWCLFGTDNDAWELQKHAGAPPYHVKRCGYAWIIANASGAIVACAPGGRVLFMFEDHAEAVLRRLAPNNEVAA